jgi:DNA-binding SARP family transcriptional activator
MRTLRISLFGQLKIEWGEHEVVKLEARRAQELLCYLLLNRERTHEREKLATLMWGNQLTGRAKQYLRQTLWQVQSKLHQMEMCEPLLLVEPDRIGVNPQASLWLDVDVFDQVYACVEKISGRLLEPRQAEMVRQTLPLYHADLLEGWYEDWCNFERERYQNIYLAFLDKLLAHSDAQQEYEAGVAYGTQILQYDRARERTHRALMRLHYMAGHRTAALQQYEFCVVALAEELDVGPAKSTIALYHQICADQVNSHPPLPNKSAPDAALHRLEEIQSTLTQLQTQVKELVAIFGSHPEDPS